MSDIPVHSISFLNFKEVKFLNLKFFEKDIYRDSIYYVPKEKKIIEIHLNFIIPTEGVKQLVPVNIERAAF